MAPVVRISDESYERLKTWAEPLDDSADDAFRKVLDAADLHRAACEASPPRVDEVEQLLPDTFGEPVSPTTVIEEGSLGISPPAIPPEIREDSISERIPTISSQIQADATFDKPLDTALKTQERMYVSLPDEFRLLGKNRRKERGILARKAYLDRIGALASRPGQWVPTEDGKTHFIGYASKTSDSPERWFFGANKGHVERHIENGTLGSFVFLCGISEHMIITVPGNLEQISEMVRLGVFATNKGQMKFHLKREPGDLFYLDGRLIE